MGKPFILIFSYNLLDMSDDNKERVKKAVAGDQAQEAEDVQEDVAESSKSVKTSEDEDEE